MNLILLPSKFKLPVLVLLLLSNCEMSALTQSKTHSRVLMSPGFFSTYSHYSTGPLEIPKVSVSLSKYIESLFNS